MSSFGHTHQVACGTRFWHWRAGSGLQRQNHFDYDGKMEDKEVVRSLAALAHPARLQVFRALVVAGPEGMTPGVMADGLGLPAATLSFHLKELATAGLVTQERQSRHLIYRAAFDRMSGLLAYLMANCCQGATCHSDAAAACC